MQRSETELGAPRLRMLSEPWDGARRLVGAQVVDGLRERRDRADRDVLRVEELEPLGERSRGEDRGELVDERLLVVREVATARGRAGRAARTAVRRSGPRARRR